MAVARAPSSAFLAAFLTVARVTLQPRDTALPILERIPSLHHLRTRFIPATLVSIPITIPIPGVLGELWDGLLRAVPKKKTSHMKKRHRQMAGKALKDVTALNKCSSCGRTKRAHVLCPYCVQSIKQWFANGFKSRQEVEVEKKRMDEIYQEEYRLRGWKTKGMLNKSGRPES